MKISYNECFYMHPKFLLLFSHTKPSVSIRALLTPGREGRGALGADHIWNKKTRVNTVPPGRLQGGGSLRRNSVLQLLTREPGEFGQWCPRGTTGDKVLCSIVLGRCPVWGQPYQAPFSSGLMGVYGHGSCSWQASIGTTTLHPPRNHSHETLLHRVHMCTSSYSLI